MATFKIYKLHFTAPLHIGSQREDEGYSMDTIQSDSIYAALVACLAKTGYAIPEDGDLGFTLSSLFPYYQRDKDAKPIYFLPMPMMAKQPELTDVSAAKKVKKVKWIDAALYDKVLAGDTLFDKSGHYLQFIQESYLAEYKLPENADGTREFMKSEVSQRVTLQSRTGEEDAKPYYVDKIVFKHNAGLYFIAEGDTTLLDKALAILAIEGLGTDRNVGFGFFEYSTDSINIELPQSANHQVALSLLIPESKEQLEQLLSSEHVAYDFTRRGGWITTPPFTTLRKNVIYGFLPGSVFQKDVACECQAIGKIVNLKPEVGEQTPDHPVWRNGKSIMLPITIK